jgi:hypothetical protein
MQKQLGQGEVDHIDADQPPLQEETAEEFVSEVTLASMHRGTEYQPVEVLLYKDTGLGYRELPGGTCALLLKEKGYLLSRYVLPTHWQAREACRRLACLANFQVPASQLFSLYVQAHGEKLGDVIKRIFIEVMELGGLPQPTYHSSKEHLEALIDFVLERSDPNTPMPPLT